MPTRHIYTPLKMLLLLLLCNTALAQQGNVWAFGFKTGLDFNFSPPKKITTGITYRSGDTINQSGGSTSIADCNGKLLLYGNGNAIYNRDHKVMPNGVLRANYGNGGWINTIVQKPGDSSIYYYIHTYGDWIPYVNNYTETILYYSVIDMKLDSGRGDVVDTAKNLILYSYINDLKNTKQHTVLSHVLLPHSNGKDHWLVATIYPADSIATFSITKNGITLEKENKNFFSPFLSVYLKANHKGDKVVAVGSFQSNKYGAVIYSFNNKTGTLTSPKFFFDFGKYASTYDLHVRSAEFSPNDSFLYISNAGAWEWTNFTRRTIWQFETYSTTIDKTGIKVFSDEIHRYSGPFSLQLGPDNKIYLIGNELYSFSIIHQPNKRGTKCNFELAALDMSPNLVGYYLPNLYFPVKNLDFRIKAGCTDTVRFTNLSDTSYFKSFQWYFGDGDSSVKYSPKHAYKKSGKYFVKLLGINQCGAKQLYTDTLEVWVPAKPGFKKDTVIYSCGQAILYLSSASKDSSQHYSYTFGDSLSADTSINPIHLYTKSGKYLLKQFVDNGYCKDSVTDSITINIEAFPKADFTAPQTKGCTPFSVQFTNLSTDAFQYKWLFDNKTDTSTSPTHTFTDTGFHSVTLLAYNNQGCIDTITKDSFIYVSPQPKPQFTYTTKKVCAGIEVNFTNQSIFSTSYIWNIDGKTDTAKYPVYIFRNNGDYKINLTAINPYCQNIDTQTVHILLPDTVKSIFSSDKKAGCPNTEVTFINQSKNAVKQTWYFGDGDTSGIFSPNHIYKQAGKYNVSLVSYSAEGCKDSITLTDYIHVLPYPEALFSTDSGTYTCERVTYTYNNKSIYADSFRWSFGDGSPIQITYAPGTLTHSYGKSGEYKITITAFNGYCIDTAVILQQVNLRKPPIANFSIENAKLCISNATTKFINQSIFGDSYIWDFGDGTVDTNKNPIHTFTKSGKYNITLIAKSKEGCTHTKIWESAISVSKKINAEFTADKTQGCAPLTVNFTPTKDNDTGLIYSWNFGNGKTSKERMPTVMFDYGKQDSFYVRLTLTNQMCTDSFGQWIKILNLREDKDTAKIILATVENNQHIQLNWQKLNLASISATVCRK